MEKQNGSIQKPETVDEIVKFIEERKYEIDVCSPGCRKFLIKLYGPLAFLIVFIPWVLICFVVPFAVFGSVAILFQISNILGSLKLLWKYRSTVYALYFCYTLGWTRTIKYRW